MKMMTAAASLAAVLVSAGAAMAAPDQFVSNQNLRYVNQNIESSIDQLQGDAQDYGGHRLDAIADLRSARADLGTALSYWKSHGAPRSVEEAVMHNTAEFPSSMNQYASNQNLREVRIEIQSAINALNGDRTDYGGYREKAVDDLQAATGQIDAALRYWFDTQHGGGGVAASDANLRYVEAHAQAAINRLNADRHDYGGHRVIAIRDIEQGVNYLNGALSYAHTQGIAAALVSQVPSVSQVLSDDSLADARSHLGSAIAALQRDAHDYSGYRERAIGSFQAAQAQLTLALNFRASH